MVDDVHVEATAMVHSCSPTITYNKVDTSRNWQVHNNIEYQSFYPVSWCHNQSMMNNMQQIYQVGETRIIQYRKELLSHCWNKYTQRLVSDIVIACWV
jgi:hypothetical protein